MKKRLSALFLAMALTTGILAGCSPAAPAPAPAPAAAATEAPAADAAATPAPAADAAKPYIAVIAKGFQHQFWQTVMKGSQDAAAKYGVDMTFEGPPSESDISAQVDMLNNALSKNPKAICLAALDTQAVTSQLTQAKSGGIPIVGFDSGVPNAPEGSIVATAATNNEAAGKVAADEMFKEAGINAKIKAATADAPVTIVVQSQDATSASIVGRTKGFVDEMVIQAATLQADAVAVTGNDVFKKASAKPAAVEIQVIVPPSTSAADAQSAAQAALGNTKNLIGYFCSNEGSVTGILAATSDGTDLDKTKGKYKDLCVIGFDAGKPQKNAVKNQYFYGSITQDPYMIGYLAIELAVKSVNGEKVDAMVDTGAKFYNSTNMDQPDIAQLLYD